MFLPGFGDGRRVEDSLLSQCRRVEKFLDPGPKGAAEPLIQGHAEPLLRTLEQLGRHISAQNRAKNPLGRPSMDLEVQRQLPCQFQKAVIQERLSGFETDGHTRAIQFGENVFGQIRHHIEIHHAFGGIQRVGI